MKKAWISVTNDLCTDQRADRTCRVLVSLGYQVTLVGRKLPGSAELDHRPYSFIRMKMLFKRGPLFYFFFNLRLFFLLLFHRADLVVSNDLDTLPACRGASRLKRVPLVYDTHEIFCEVPELQGRMAKKIWERMEKSIFPGLKHVITVNESIAGWYEKRYGIRPVAVRNIPDFKEPSMKKTRKELGLPEDLFLVILQGSGINVDRGAEELLESMMYLQGVHLLLLGGGDVVDKLKQRAAHPELMSKVTFLPRMPYHEMIQYTLHAGLGATLDKDTNLNYRYSLPNKLFDYIHCGIPVLSSALPEVAGIVREYDLGMVVTSHDPERLAEHIRTFAADRERQAACRANAGKAARLLTWLAESEKLKNVFLNIG